MKILVGSKNPVKLAAVEEAFKNYHDGIEVISIAVESNVPHQPVNGETYFGARTRALKLKEINDNEKMDANYFVGIEGGIKQTFNKWFAFGCMCVIDKEGNEGFGTSPQFELPDEVTERLLKREELGDVMDDIMNMKNTKQKKGAIGFFTNGVMDRKQLYVPGLIAALVPFNNKEMYFKND